MSYVVPGFASRAGSLLVPAGRQVARPAKNSSGKIARVKLDLDILMLFWVKLKKAHLPERGFRGTSPRFAQQPIKIAAYRLSVARLVFQGSFPV
jgi:hypothetical protein